jgi:hypothetical protein
VSRSGRTSRVSSVAILVGAAVLNRGRNPRRCKEKVGENETIVLVSPYAYFEEFGEKYTVEIYKTVFEVNGEKNVYYEVGPNQQKAKSGCLYVLLTFELKRIDGALFVVQMPY